MYNLSESCEKDAIHVLIKNELKTNKWLIKRWVSVHSFTGIPLFMLATLNGAVNTISTRSNIDRINE